MDAEVAGPFAVALLGIFGALLGSTLARRHDPQQAARTIMMRPAEDFARQAYKTLTALRHITPPSATQHRNAVLLTDKRLRESRLAECRVTLDDLRGMRASIPLMFSPKSAAAEYARRVLDRLRFCLEISEAFYDRNTVVDLSADGWQASPSQAWRAEYKHQRKAVYEDDLKKFFEVVAQRMVRPSWRLKPYSGEDPGENFTSKREQLMKFRRGDDEGPIPK